MQKQVCALFEEMKDAERALAALLDYRIDRDDITVVCTHIREEEDWPGHRVREEIELKEGISTTSARDALKGARTGLGWGVLWGAMGALGVLWVPGAGLVLGGGALASALSAGGAYAAGYGIAGGVIGYLKDQGVKATALREFEEHLEEGGVVIELAVPTGKVDAETAQSIFSKYGATHIVMEE